MRSLIAAIFVLLSLQSAGAGNYQDIDGKWWTTIDPPKHYLDAPLSVSVELHFWSREEIYRNCRALTQKAAQFGCAQLWPGHCDIYIVDDLPKPLRDSIHLHELAHCRGWPSDHPVD